MLLGQFSDALRVQFTLGNWDIDRMGLLVGHGNHQFRQCLAGRVYVGGLNGVGGNRVQLVVDIRAAANGRVVLHHTQ